MLEKIRRWVRNSHIDNLEKQIININEASESLIKNIEKQDERIKILQRDRDIWKKVALNKRFKDEQTLNAILELQDENNKLMQQLVKKRNFLYE